MSVSGHGREYNSIYSNTAYRIIAGMGRANAKPKCQSVDALDSFLGSIIRSIDEEEIRVEEEEEERQAAVGGSSLRSKASRVISLSLLPPPGGGGGVHVRKRVGGPRDRTNGFLLVYSSELYGCFVTSTGERVRGVHRPFEYSRCSALHACHVKITYRLSPLRLSRVNNLPPVCKLIPPILSPPIGQPLNQFRGTRRFLKFSIPFLFLFFFLGGEGKKREVKLERERINGNNVVRVSKWRGF